jgi:CRP/FNR family transcriptional regulator, cyclic AMP receptor protein
MPPPSLTLGPVAGADAPAAFNGSSRHDEWPRYRETLKDLPADVAQAMQDAGHQRRWRRGQVLLQQGDLHDAVMVCLQGRLDIMLAGPTGRDTLLRWLKPGEIVGLPTVLAGLPFPATIQAAGPAATLHVERKAFVNILKRHPEGAIAVAVLLSHRVAEVFRFIEKTSQRPLPERVTYALARLARQHGQPVKGDVLRLNITQSDLATAAAGSRQRVHLELMRLQSQGVVELGYGSILVRLSKL